MKTNLVISTVVHTTPLILRLFGKKPYRVRVVATNLSDTYVHSAETDPRHRWAYYDNFVEASTGALSYEEYKRLLKD